MQAEIILMYIVIFLYGVIIGSFLNVLIYRIPKKENIAIKRSHCMGCGHTLQWYDLVPLGSYIFLGGKCRYCKERISMQYPLVEGINGIGYVLIFVVNGFSWLSILFCLVYSIFLVISVIDLRTYEIPPSLNIAIFVLAIVRVVLEVVVNKADMLDVAEYLIGFCAVSGFMLIALLIGRKVAGVDAFGGGDIKLMAAAGLFVGVKQVVLAFVIGCILGAVIHSIRMKISEQDHVLAFGPYLCAGLFIAMLFGNEMISWYLNLLA